MELNREKILREVDFAEDDVILVWSDCSKDPDGVVTVNAVEWVLNIEECLLMGSAYSSEFYERDGLYIELEVIKNLREWVGYKKQEGVKHYATVQCMS